MKRKLLACSLFVAAIAANAQIQSENFEAATIPAGWTTQVTGAGDWTFGSNIPPYTGNPTFPSKAAIFNDDALGGSAAPSVAALLSPSIDITSYSTVNVSFDYYMNEISQKGFLRVEAFDGSTWHQLLFRDTDQTTMTNVTYDVTAYKNANFQIRFVFDDEGGWSWGAAIDNFVLSGTLDHIEQHKTLFGIYPNPASDVLQFTANSDIATIAVHSISGQKVLQQTGSITSVDVSSLAPGAYLVTATLGDGKSDTVKFFKK